MFFELRKNTSDSTLMYVLHVYTLRYQLTLGLARASMAFILLRLRLAVVARFALAYKIIRLAARDRNKTISEL